MPRPRRAVVLVLAVVLAGCVEIGLAKDPSGVRGTALDALDEARATAEEWNADAKLLAVSAGAIRAGANLFAAPKPGEQTLADGHMPSWRYTFVVPGSVAVLMVEVAGDGEVLDTRKLDLSRLSPEVGPYAEYFDLTPVEPEWLDTERLVAVLAANATAEGFFDREVDTIEYTLRPDVRHLFAWRVTLVDDDRFYEADVDPQTWQPYETTYDLGRDAPTVTVAGGAASGTPSGLVVDQVYGYRGNATGGIGRVAYYLKLAPGARPVDLAALVVDERADDAVVRHANAGDAAFALAWLRGEGDGTTLTAGALATVTVDLAHPLGPRETARLTLVPARGAPVDGGFDVPATLGNSAVARMR